MLFTDGKIVVSTDNAELKRYAKASNTPFAWYYTSEKGVSYISMEVRINARRIMLYSYDNPNKRPDFTIHYMTKRFIANFLAGKPNKLRFRYDLHKIHLAKLHLEIFKDLFGSNLNPKTVKEIPKKMQTCCHLEGQSLYLIIGANFTYWARTKPTKEGHHKTVEDGDISDFWKEKLEPFRKIVNCRQNRNL